VGARGRASATSPERALADVGQAVDAYRNALLSTPDDLPALAGLARGLVRQRDWSNAAATLRRLAAVESERDARVGHLVTLGELLAGPAEDPEGAADAFEGALAVHPSNAVAIDRLDKLLTELGGAVPPGGGAGTLPRGDARRARPAHAAGGAVERTAGVQRRAVDELRIVVSGHEGDVGARAELARVLEAADRPPEAITEHIALLRVEPCGSIRCARCDACASAPASAGARCGQAAAMVALGLASRTTCAAVRESRVRWAPRDERPASTGEFDSFVPHPDARHPRPRCWRRCPRCCRASTAWRWRTGA
jgi:thioredoxin-like negative regulator of GroEL